MYDFGMATTKADYPPALYFIAAFKLLKSLFLLALAIGALRLMQKGAAFEVYRWADSFRVDPGNRYVRMLLVRVAGLNEKTLRELSVGTFLYSALFLTEGCGLLFRKRWAEYFTSIVTASFIPLEIYELIRRATLARGIVLVLNIAVVIYLVMDIQRSR
jgi:uncharacterized membrane protein (DUF2068 family)